MTNQNNKGSRMGNWHTDKRFMVALLATVIPTLIMSAWNTTFLLRTLDTNPPIVERIIRLEYHASEHGLTNQKILDELQAARKERAIFREEQSKRTTTVYDAADHMKNRRIHK